MMFPLKSTTKEETWRPDELKAHIQGRDDDKRRKSKGDVEQKKHKEGEPLDRRPKDPDRDARREKDKQREKERSKHRDQDKHRDRRKEEDRYQEKRDVEKSSHRDDEEKRRNREERVNSERLKDRERDRYRDVDREAEKQRRRAERNERKKEGAGNDERQKYVGKEQERRERHRRRESENSRYEQEDRDGEKRGKRSDTEHSGHKEREHRRHREDGEHRRRDQVSDTGHAYKAQSDRKHYLPKESNSDFKGVKDGQSEGAKHRDVKERDKQPERTKASSSKEENERRKIKKEVEYNATEEDKQSDKDCHDEEYEDDFEDYEDDFEDASPLSDDGEKVEELDDNNVKKEENREELSQEMEAIQRAITEENERIYSAKSRSSQPTPIQRDLQVNRTCSQIKVIDFVSAKQREINQKVAKKQKKRSEELLRLIDLDFSVTFSLLDLPPVSEYDMYIKEYGSANTKQASVQCNEDNADRDIQTEDIDMTDKWTQHPPDSNAACGGPKSSPESNDESRRLSVDSQRLAKFLHSAGQVMAVLLEENVADSTSLNTLCSDANTLSFSDGCFQLNTKLPFLHGRQVSLIQFSRDKRQTFLTVHLPLSKSSKVRLESETVICVWSIWEPSRPQKILLYDSEVRCCCFSPGKASLVFAGTAVGSVVLWDLREPSSAHLSVVIDNEEWTLLYPTFSTDAVMSGVDHLSPVVSIEPVIASAESSFKGTLTADVDEMLGLSFQLGSLGESGILTLWVVIELPKESISGSQTDLGLRPSGKVKLLHSSSLMTTEKSFQDVVMGCGPPACLQLKFLPSDSNHYFIGTNMGLVRHNTRHRIKVLPKFYRSGLESFRPVEVTTFDFNYLAETFFLVGCSDGSVRLHSVSREDPLMEWSGSSTGGPVLSVQWSQTRPAVFCVLDTASDLHIWDLNVKDHGPIITEKMNKDRVTTMALFGDADKQNAFSGIALAKESGKVEIQYFSKTLAVPTDADKDKLHSILQEAL